MYILDNYTLEPTLLLYHEWVIMKGRFFMKTTANTTTIATINTIATIAGITASSKKSEVLTSDLKNAIDVVNSVSTKKGLTAQLVEIVNYLNSCLISANLGRGENADGRTNTADMSKNPQCGVFSKEDPFEKRVKEIPLLYGISQIVEDINGAIKHRYDRETMAEYITTIFPTALESAPQLVLDYKKINFNNNTLIGFVVVLKAKGYTFSFEDVVGLFPQLKDAYGKVAEAFLSSNKGTFQEYWKSLKVGDVDESTVIGAYQEWSASTQKERRLSFHNLKSLCGDNSKTNGKVLDEILVALLKYDYSRKGFKEGNLTLNEKSLGLVILSTIARDLLSK